MDFSFLYAHLYFSIFQNDPHSFLNICKLCVWAWRCEFLNIAYVWRVGGMRVLFYFINSPGTFITPPQCDS